MDRASILIRPVLLIVLAAALVNLPSCDNPYVSDGSDDKGILEVGGYFYFVDNEDSVLRMLDPNLRTVKSWSLTALAGERFQGVTCDGDHLWLSVAGSADLIIQVDATGDTLVPLTTLEAPPSGQGTIRDITWYDDYLWAVNSGSEFYSTPPTLYKLDPLSGEIIDQFVLPGPEPRAVSFVGEYPDAYGRQAEPGVYIADVEWDSVYVFMTNKMIFGGGFSSPEPPRGPDYIFPVGLSHDTRAFWLVNSSSAGDHLYRLDRKGKQIERIELPFVTPGPIVWAPKNLGEIGPPIIDGVVPNTGTPGDELTLTITGSNFSPGNSLSVSLGEGIAVEEVLVVDGSTIEANIEILPDATTGPRHLRLTNGDGQTIIGRDLFQVLATDPLDGFLWLVDANSDLLYKIRILDTAIVDSWDSRDAAPGGSPQGLTFIGDDLWLAAGGSDDQLLRLDASGASLAATQSFTAPPGGEGVIREITFDGEFLWAANNSSDMIYKLDTANGQVLDSIPTPGDEVRGIVWADGQLYANDRTIDSVFVYDSGGATWTAVFAAPIPPDGTEGNRFSTGMAFDGVNFWMANSTYEYDYLFQVSMDGAVLRTYVVPDRGDAQPTGLAFSQE